MKNNKSSIIGDVYDDVVGYQTCDLYLAAFFITAGCNMIKSIRDSGTRRVHFVFEKNGLIEELKLNYFGRKAKVDAQGYSDNIKSLKSLCHNMASNKTQ